MSAYGAAGAPDPARPAGLVVIPAHNEGAVIRRCLDALFRGFGAGELDVVVACNGSATTRRNWRGPAVIRCGSSSSTSLPRRRRCAPAMPS